MFYIDKIQFNNIFIYDRYKDYLKQLEYYQQDREKFQVELQYLEKLPIKPNVLQTEHDILPLGEYYNTRILQLRQVGNIYQNFKIYIQKQKLMKYLLSPEDFIYLLDSQYRLEREGLILPVQLEIIKRELSYIFINDYYLYYKYLQDTLKQKIEQEISSDKQFIDDTFTFLKYGIEIKEVSTDQFKEILLRIFNIKEFQDTQEQIFTYYGNLYTLLSKIIEFKLPYISLIKDIYYKRSFDSNRNVVEFDKILDINIIQRDKQIYQYKVPLFLLSFIPNYYMNEQYISYYYLIEQYNNFILPILNIGQSKKEFDYEVFINDLNIIENTIIDGKITILTYLEVHKKSYEIIKDNLYQDFYNQNDIEKMTEFKQYLFELLSHITVQNILVTKQLPNIYNIEIQSITQMDRLQKNSSIEVFKTGIDEIDKQNIQMYMKVMNKKSTFEIYRKIYQILKSDKSLNISILFPSKFIQKSKPKIETTSSTVKTPVYHRRKDELSQKYILEKNLTKDIPINLTDYYSITKFKEQVLNTMQDDDVEYIYKNYFYSLNDIYYQPENLQVMSVKKYYYQKDVVPLQSSKQEKISNQINLVKVNLPIYYNQIINFIDYYFPSELYQIKMVYQLPNQLDNIFTIPFTSFVKIFSQSNSDDIVSEGGTQIQFVFNPIEEFFGYVKSVYENIESIKILDTIKQYQNTTKSILQESKINTQEEGISDTRIFVKGTEENYNYINNILWYPIYKPYIRKIIDTTKGVIQELIEYDDQMMTIQSQIYGQKLNENLFSKKILINSYLQSQILKEDLDQLLQINIIQDKHDINYITETINKILNISDNTNIINYMEEDIYNLFTYLQIKDNLKMVVDEFIHEKQKFNILDNFDNILQELIDEDIKNDVYRIISNDISTNIFFGYGIHNTFLQIKSLQDIIMEIIDYLQNITQIRIIDTFDKVPQSIFEDLESTVLNSIFTITYQIILSNNFNLNNITKSIADIEKLDLLDTLKYLVNKFYSNEYSMNLDEQITNLINTVNINDILQEQQEIFEINDIVKTFVTLDTLSLIDTLSKKQNLIKINTDTKEIKEIINILMQKQTTKLQSEQIDLFNSKMKIVSMDNPDMYEELFNEYTKIHHNFVLQLIDKFEINRKVTILSMDNPDMYEELLKQYKELIISDLIYEEISETISNVKYKLKIVSMDNPDIYEELFFNLIQKIKVNVTEILNIYEKLNSYVSKILSEEIYNIKEIIQEKTSKQIEQTLLITKEMFGKFVLNIKEILNENVLDEIYNLDSYSKIYNSKLNKLIIFDTIDNKLKVIGSLLKDIDLDDILENKIKLYSSLLKDIDLDDILENKTKIYSSLLKNIDLDDILENKIKLYDLLLTSIKIDNLLENKIKLYDLLLTSIKIDNLLENKMKICETELENIRMDNILENKIKLYETGLENIRIDNLLENKMKIFDKIIDNIQDTISIQQTIKVNSVKNYGYNDNPPTKSSIFNNRGLVILEGQQDIYDNDGNYIETIYYDGDIIYT